MSLISYAHSETSVLLRVKILNSAATTGAGKTGLLSSSTGLVISTIADNEATATAYTAAGSTTETITTLGTYAAPTESKCRFKEVDATNHPGVYEIHLANARFAVASAKSLLVSISGATDAAETDVLIPLTQFDPYDVVRGGLTALPNAAADAAGGLPISDAGGLAMDGLATEANVNTLIGTPSVDIATDIATVTTRIGTPSVDIATDIDAILVDTNELQTDWFNGGRLDLILDIIAADVVNIDGAAMRGTDSAALAATALSTAVWTAPPTGFLAATFPAGTVANTTNITAGNIGTLAGATTVVLTDASLTTAKLGTFALAKTTNITGFNDITAAQVESVILDEADATALLSAIAAKVEEFLINEGDSTATIAAIATAVNAAVVAGTVGVDVAAVKTKTDFLPSATAGAAGGVFIAGTNAATAITTGLTTTFTGNLTGSVGSLTGHTVQTGDTYALANGATGFAAINTDVEFILADTGTDGVVVASGSKTGYTLTATTGLGNQTADITGNLSGSVGSVTGAVGSVTGHTPQTGDTFALANGGAGFVAIDTVVDAIKVKTDQFVFTIANQVDANALTAAGDATEAKQDQIIAAVITNATGVDIAADIIALKAETVLIVADTNELQTDDVPGLISALNNLSTAQVATELAAYDGPTNAEMVAAFTEIKGATWATTDTLEAIRDRGDSAWLTAVGFATPTNITAGTITTVTTLTGHTPQTGDTFALANGTEGFVATNAVVDAVKVTTDQFVFTIANQVDSNTLTLSGGGDATAANQTTILANIATAQADLDIITGATGVNLLVATQASIDAIEADTNELQTDDVPGLITALNDVSIADIFTTVMTEAYAADGAEPTLTQVLYLMLQRATEFAITGTSITVKKLDGTTTAAVLTMDDDASPTSSTRSS